MNHRVSIVVSNTSIESGLGSPEVCSNFGKASCSLASQNQSKRMCSLPFFFIVEPSAEFTCFRLSCFVIVFLSRVNAQQWSRATQGPSTPVRESGVFVHFFLLFFFFFFSCQLTIHSRALRLSVCCELQAADEKNLTPQSHVFSPSSQYIRMANACLKKANPRTESYTSFSRTPSVDRPYAFGAFPSSLWSLRGLRRSAFLFQLLFL